MVSYLLEWVKLLYFLNTFYFPAPSRSHLQLCFCGNVAYFIKQTKKKSSFQFCCIYMGFWSACVFEYHTQQFRAPFDFLHWAEQSHSNTPFPATSMLMQGYHLDMGKVDDDDFKVCFNYSRMFCISIKYTPV